MTNATAAEGGEASTAMAVTVPGGPLTRIEVPVEEPGPGHVRVAIQASGICFADLGLATSASPKSGFPVVPGHEIAGTVAALGADVDGWSVGDRVAVGWFGGSCGHCAACRAGDPVHCAERKTPGVDYQGGWAESVTVPAAALARIPAGLDFADAAPMGCAGVTVFNAIRRAGVKPGGTVAVFGLGGLGHLAVLFAHAMGYRTVAIARGPERRELAEQLGAAAYVDSNEQDVAEALRTLGGADLIVATASNTAAVSGLVTGLRVGGRLTVVGVDGGTLDVPVAQLVANGFTVTGNLTGSARDIEEAMEFAALSGIRPVVERMPLADAATAVKRLANGDARFRIVLEPTA